MEKQLRCTIKLLDDQLGSITVEFPKDAKGRYLLNKACESQSLEEKDYFGLRYVDGEKQRHWLDPTKSIAKQLKGTGPHYTCIFRVKYYPEDPGAVREEITRYQLFLQLKRDLFHGRLLCSIDDAAWLGAYIIQSNLGDYDEDDHEPGYGDSFEIIPRQPEKLERKMEEIHEMKLKGQVPAEAEKNFITKAHALATYGVDPHPVRDIYGTQLYVGLTYRGLSLFKGNQLIQNFPWPDIKKLSYEGRTFFVHAVVDEKVNHGFRVATSSATKHLWKCAMEHQAFFHPNHTPSLHICRTIQSMLRKGSTEKLASILPLCGTSSLRKKAKARLPDFYYGASNHNAFTLALWFRRGSDVSIHSSGGFFRGSKFRFSGRTQKEALETSQSLSREEPPFARSPPLIRPRRVRSCKDANSPPSDSLEDVGFQLSDQSLPSTPEKIEELPLTFEKAPSESTTGSNQALLDSEDMVDAMNERNKCNGEEREVIEEVTVTYQEQEMTECKLPNNNHVDGAMLAPSHRKTKQEEQKSWSGVVMKLMICSILLALILFILTSIVLYESSLPAFEPVRQSPVSQNFESAYYAPSRAWVVSGYQQFTNTCYEPTKQFISAQLQMISNKFD
ncbi:FERM domain-containing protein 5-like isoform X2 [Amphiura filiformis]|uniref:FERM domain-containing protein 5-like isoform X2 n=1 Tax=Amphiura filiformis TaxID=82378 RepID=UPI003B217B90